jgi:hypothetical protein
MNKGINGDVSILKINVFLWFAKHLTLLQSPSPTCVRMISDSGPLPPGETYFRTNKTLVKTPTLWSWAVTSVQRGVL